MDFCEEIVDLDPKLWNTRVNLLRTCKSNSVEKFISRVLETEKIEIYEDHLVNAILYRSFLFMVELNTSEALLTLSQVGYESSG
jgi:hypothetical protein